MFRIKSDYGFGKDTSNRGFFKPNIGMLEDVFNRQIPKIKVILNNKIYDNCIVFPALSKQDHIDCVCLGSPYDFEFNKHYIDSPNSRQWLAAYIYPFIDCQDLAIDTRLRDYLDCEHITSAIFTECTFEIKNDVFYYCPKTVIFVSDNNIITQFINYDEAVHYHRRKI